MKKTNFYIVLILILLSVNSFAGDLLLLQDNREKVKLPVLTAEEKNTVLTLSKVALGKMYVNLEHKKQLYKVDPIGELDRITNDLNSIPEEKFQERMIKVFSSVKDFHVNYYLPYPYQCYGTYIPVYFYTIENNRVIVDVVDTDKLNTLGINETIKSGDELVSYNGMNLDQLIQDQKVWTSGSTKAADMHLIVERLSYISQYENLVPNEDKVEFTLKRSNGEIYSVTIPWIVEGYQKCLTKKEAAGIGNGTESIVEIRKKEHYQKLEKKRRRTQELNAKKLNLKIEGTGEVSTEDPNIKYKVITEENRQYGYIKLSSFTPAKSIDKSLDIIRDILRNKLNETHALIIDLRGNYGGKIDFAESLAAMLYPKKVNRLPFYVKANDYTKAGFDEDSYWYKLIEQRKQDDEIVGPYYFQSLQQLKSISQEYYGKVVLVTNEECFSSCDLFSSSMKDVAHAPIYGRAESTFGGGANVWNLAELENMLKKLGLPTKMPRLMGMRITFRHSHRISTNELVEDKGIESDVVVPVTYNDIVNGTSSILRRVLDDLNADESLKKSSDYALDFSSDYVIVHGDDDYNDLTYKSLDRLLAKSVNNDPIDLILTDGKTILPNNYIKNRIQQVELFGFQNDDVKIRKSFFVEKLNQFKKWEDFKWSTDFVTFNTKDLNNNSCGFKYDGTNWYIGEDYCLDSTIKLATSIDFSNSSASKLSFIVKGKLEENFDFVKVNIWENGKFASGFEYLTGEINNQIVINLNNYTSKKIDIEVVVTSDELQADKGITVSEFKLE